jgi:hypothetical protein
MMLSYVAVFGASVSAEGQQSDFRVTIIAVTKFNDPKLSGPDETDLNDANTAAAKALKNYFESLNITPPPDLYIVPNETTWHFLHNWLFRDLQNDSRTGVHLIFVLTHGLLDPKIQSEFYVATSDTYKDDIPGHAIRGGDFIDAFHDMRPRATVFLFLDTCGSGAIDNEQLQRDLQSQPDFASRVLIIAAANADELAYRARFTRTLLGIWAAKSPTRHCGPRQIETFLTDSLRKVPGVSPYVKQTVRVVAPLSPDFCIENFNSTQRFLMLYNASRSDISITLQAEDESEPEPTIDLHKQDLMMPISELRPTKYQLVAKRKMGNGQVDQNFVGNIDLTAEPAKVQVLFSSDPLDQPRAQQSAAQYLDSRSALPSVVESLQQASTKTVDQLFDNTRGQLQVVEAQQVPLRQAAQALQPELESKTKAAETARDAYQEAVAHLNQSQTVEGIADSKGEVKRTYAELETASADYERTIRKDHEIHDKIQQLSAQKAQVQAEVNRVYALKNSVNDFAAKRASALAVENSAGTELQSAFPDLQRTGRGLVAVLTGVSEEEAAKSDRLRKFVDISNKYPMMNVEIELLQGGESTIENQVAIRARAAKFMQTFREIGLKSENAIARGFVVPGKLPLTVDLIMSQP